MFPFANKEMTLEENEDLWSFLTLDFGLESILIVCKSFKAIIIVLSVDF